MRRFVATCLLVTGALAGVAGGCFGTTARAQSSEAAHHARHQRMNEVPDFTHASPKRRWLAERSNTYMGPVGGIHVVEAGSGGARSLRVQLATDFFRKSDYLHRRDDVRNVGSALSIGITPIRHLEISAAFTLRSVRDDGAYAYADRDLRSVGDPHLNVKGYGEAARGVTLGGDISLSPHTEAGKDGLDYAGTSLGLRGNLSFDLREMSPQIPLELRANVGYVFDQSRKVMRDVERERLGDLVASGLARDASGRDEVRHLAYRQERLAYAVNRVDHAFLALGIEAPFELRRKVSLHAIAEWDMKIPVNRQGYDCSRAAPVGRNEVDGPDRCLADAGASAWPQRITLGTRLFPAARGFSLLTAVEIGVGGRGEFVRELAPVAPYRMILAASYNFGYGRRAHER